MWLKNPQNKNTVALSKLALSGLGTFTQNPFSDGWKWNIISAEETWNCQASAYSMHCGGGVCVVTKIKMTPEYSLIAEMNIFLVHHQVFYWQRFVLIYE